MNCDELPKPKSFGSSRAEGRGLEPRGPCGLAAFRERFLANSVIPPAAMVEALRRAFKRELQAAARSGDGQLKAVGASAGLSGLLPGKETESIDPARALRGRGRALKGQQVGDDDYRAETE